MLASKARDVFLRLFMRFVSVVSVVMLSLVVVFGPFVNITRAQGREFGGPTPVASSIPSVVPSPVASATPEYPGNFGPNGDAGPLDVFKNIIDKQACVAITAVSQAVLDYPTLAKKMCELAAERRYNECYKETGGDPLTPYRYNLARLYRKCAGTKNTTLEGCAMLQDFAEAFINACENEMLTMFPTEPEVTPIPGFGMIN